MEGFIGLLPLVLLFAIFYFMLIRPQQKQQKQRQEMLNNLKKGDRVVTIGGMHGTVKEINDNFLVLRVTDNVNLKFNRQGIAEIIND